jgi:selenocysteine-specific elongation factor
VPGRAGRGGPTRLHVDRVFTLRGIGTVVTGTLWSGRIARGDEVVILPEERPARVRSIQVHDEPAPEAEPGRRVALALTGVGWRELRRGDLVCHPADRPRATYRLDAALALEPDARPLVRGARVHVHHGTREAPARVMPLDGEQLVPGHRARCQLRLEAPLLADRGDLLVLRQIAPPDTLGGGEVLDPDAPKQRRSPFAADPGFAEPEPPAAPAARPGEAALRLAALLEAEGERPRPDGALEQAAGLDGPAAREAWRELERARLAVRVGRNQHFHPETLDRLLASVVEVCRRNGGATIAEVRDELDTSRRYAQALLEHLDGVKVTVRRGDRHVLRAGRAP